MATIIEQKMQCYSSKTGEAGKVAGIFGSG